MEVLFLSVTCTVKLWLLVSPLLSVALITSVYLPISVAVGDKVIVPLPLLLSWKLAKPGRLTADRGIASPAASVAVTAICLVVSVLMITLAIVANTGGLFGIVKAMVSV